MTQDIIRAPPVSYMFGLSYTASNRSLGEAKSKVAKLVGNYLHRRGIHSGWSSLFISDQVNNV